MTNEELVKQIQNGQNEQQNVELLLKANQGMIYKVCRKYSRNEYGIGMEDLYQESALSIYDAIRNYDESKGASFINYFVFWQEQYLRRYTERQNMINIKSKTASVKQYQRFCNMFYQQFGVTPTDQEASLYFNIPVHKIEDIRTACFLSQVRSLDYQYEGSEDESNIEVGEEDHNIEAVEKNFDNEQLRQCIDRHISKLPENQQKAIRQKYLNGEKVFDDKRLKSLVETGLRKIRHDQKAMNELRSYVDWIDSRSYKIGYGSWRNGLTIDLLAIKRLDADLQLRKYRKINYLIMKLGDEYGVESDSKP